MHGGYFGGKKPGGAGFDPLRDKVLGYLAASFSKLYWTNINRREVDEADILSRSL